MERRHENGEHPSLIDRRAFLKSAVGSSAVLLASEMLTGCAPATEFDAHQIAKRIYLKEQPLDKEANLATTMTWQMAGLRQDIQGIILEPIQPTIEDRDTGEYQTNPPIGLFGPHFRLPAQWQLTTRLSNTEGLSIQCYGKLPLIRDDYRIENESIRLTLLDDTVHVQSWQTQDTVLYDVYFSVSPSESSERILQLECADDQLTISLDHTQIGRIDEGGVFNSKTLWLGFDTEKDRAHISQLSLSADEPIMSVDPMSLAVPKTANSLEDMARQINPNLHIGATIAPEPLVENRIYDAIALGGNYGSLTFENVMKPVHLMPQPDTPTFTTVDTMVDVANKHGVDVHGHTLVFGESLPEWMRQLPYETATERNAIREVMTHYITTIMQHFKGRVKSWDVINEPLAPLEDEKPAWRQHLWYNAMGKDYIELALQTARRVDPDALLFINENALENDNDSGSRNRWRMLMDEIAIPLKKKGLLDGIGLQGHVAELPRDAIDPTTLTNHFHELNRHQLLARLSEIDVDTSSEQARANQYSNTLQACINASNCIGFTMWGVMGGYENEGTAWSSDGRPLLAIEQMKDVLKRK